MTILPDIKFYDTCSLLLAGELAFENELFLISSITLKELENIKNSNYKDEEIKYNARLVIKLLNKYPDKYEIIIHKNREKLKFDIDINSNDSKILSDAIFANNVLYPDRILFVTNDLALKEIANLFFGNDMIKSIEEESDNYKGYIEISCGDAELAKFYQDLNHNHFNLLVGEYLILKNNNGEIVDIKAWNGATHRDINYCSFNSNYLGKIEPYKKDIYQKLLFDSLTNNKITMIKGKAGTGKTIISLGYLISKLEKGEIDKIIVFCNTIATANSAKLGLIIG